jgi:predicted exporter
VEAYEQLGVPAAALQAEIETIKQLPLVTIDDALAGPLGQRWRSVWLGKQPSGEYAGMITLLGLSDAAVLERIATDISGTRLIDRTGDLNRIFSATRIEAAELKAISYVIAAFFLWLAFGRRAALRILCIPVAAAACTLAALGYLGQPLTFFSLFGLLLVSAIATDYAIFMHEQIAGASASLIGIVLAGATTLLSFGLLAVSGTPAIANFGLSVALGVMFSLLFAPWVKPIDYKEH